MIKQFLICTMTLIGCGRAQFSLDTTPAPDLSVSIVTTGTDFYVETKQEFSNQVTGDIQLSKVLFLGSANWPGGSNLQLELRAALSGTTEVGQVSAGLTKPVGWDSAIEVLTVTVPASSTNFQLRSADLKDLIAPILRQGDFWILGRFRYSGLDLGRTLTLRDVYVHAEGIKNLGAFSPLLNLVF